MKEGVPVTDKTFEVQNIPLSMYQISGNRDLVSKDAERLLDKKSVDIEINKKDKEVAEGITLVRRIREFKGQKEVVHMVRQALANPDIEVQIDAVKNIMQAPEEEKASLFKEVFDTGNPVLQVQALRYVSCLGQIEERAFFAKAMLNSSDHDVFSAACSSVYDFETGGQKDELQRVILKKVEEGLRSDDLFTRVKYAEKINYVPEPEKELLRKKIPLIIEDCLKSTENATQSAIAGLIWNIGDGILPTLFNQSVLDSIDIKTIGLIAGKVNHIKDQAIKDVVQKTVLDRVKRSLKDADIKVKIDALNIVDKLPLTVDDQEEIRKEVFEITMEYLVDVDPGVQMQAVKLIQWLPVQKKNDITSLLIEKGLGNALVSPALYDQGDITDMEFKRHQFDKSGSDTMLIGGDLKNKLIMRRIKPVSFIAWKKAFEDYEFWGQQGFDYVPIEPIQDYLLQSDGLVNVFSGVLDLDAKTWMSRTSRFSDEIMIQRERILTSLKALGVFHGHPHYANFCLRFFRNNGEIDFSTPPRVYLIDFDQAGSFDHI